MREKTHLFIMDHPQARGPATRPSPEPSARHGLSMGQGAVLTSLAATAATALAIWPKGAVTGLGNGLWTLFLIISLARCLAVILSLKPRVSTPPPLSIGSLPGYSIIVPLYQEANMVAQMVANLRALTYPRDRLDVIFVVEANDPATQAALESACLPPWMRVLVAQPGSPQTKARACNIALDQVRGGLVVIYDAEDRPDPRQLIEAAGRFAFGGDRLACLQAPLRITLGKGFWARQFALEYAAHFETLLPALSRIGSAMPLGGTSNHLRVAPLRALGGWDPYNVTEDADLGFRLASAGLRTEMLHLPTWETPTGSFQHWLPQRARWLKGYLQTLVVWSGSGHRLPASQQAALWMTLGVAVLSATVHGPISLWLVIETARALLGLGPFVPVPGLVLFAIGWTSAALSIVIGAKRAGYPIQFSDLVLTVPYWPMASIAAIRALFQLIRRPHHWDKTPHKPEPLRTGP